MKIKMCCLFFGSFSATLLFWVGFLAFSQTYIPFVIDKAHAIIDVASLQLSPVEKNVMQRALESGEVVDVKSFVDSVSGFYTSVINMLIFLVSLTTIMVVIYVKQRTYEVSREAAEETAKEVVLTRATKIMNESGVTDRIYNHILPRLVSAEIEDRQMNMDDLMASVSELQDKVDRMYDGNGGGEDEKIDL